MNKLVIWKDGTHKLVEGATREYEADTDWLVTIPQPQDVTAVDLLRRAKNHMAERETYEEAVTTDDLIAEIDTFLNTTT